MAEPAMVNKLFRFYDIKHGNFVMYQTNVLNKKYEFSENIVLNINGDGYPNPFLKFPVTLKNHFIKFTVCCHIFLFYYCFYFILKGAFFAFVLLKKKVRIQCEK